MISQPVYVEAPDSMAPAMGWLALFGAGVVMFGIFVLLNAVMGVRPDVVAGCPAGRPEGKGMMYLADGAGRRGGLFRHRPDLREDGHAGGAAVTSSI